MLSNSLNILKESLCFALSNPFVLLLSFVCAIVFSYIGYIPIVDDIGYFLLHFKKMPDEYRKELKSNSIFYRGDKN